MIAEPRSSLAGRLTGLFALTALLSVLLVGLLLVGLLGLASAEVALRDLRRQSAVLAREPRFLERDPAAGFRVLRPALGLAGAALYRIGVDGDLVLVAGSEVVPPARLDADALKAGQVVEGRYGGMVFVARSGRRAQLVAVLAKRAGFSSDLLGPVVGRLSAAALIATAIAAAAAWFAARRIARPLRHLAEATASIARGSFDRRVPVESADEIGAVASSFNEMAERLGESDRRQREFFLSISHELRTPLTAIQGYAEAIEDGTASGKTAVESASVIVGESKRLSRLVSDLLDLARVDAGRFAVSLGNVEVADVLRTVRQAFAPKAEDANVELTVVSGSGHVAADEGRLVQVISNLVENALRYTPGEKGITLQSLPGEDVTEIRVTDGGVGFDPSDLDRAFERQYLWQKYKGVRDVGTGLGLAITKELVEAMGGSVSASSASGGGAEFTVRLPTARDSTSGATSGV